MTFSLISKDVFVFIKNLSDGKDSVYSRFMDSATFLIPNARTLTKIVEGIDKLDMNNHDTMEEVVYEDLHGTDAIVDVGFMDNNRQRNSQDIHYDMLLSPLDFLVAVYAPAFIHMV